MDETLFDFTGIAGQANKSDTVGKSSRVSEEDISRVRSRFIDADIVDQNERKYFVERTLEREVSSLRDLLVGEIPRVIYALNEKILATKSKSIGQRSAWDEREEDTWIDKL